MEAVILAAGRGSRLGGESGVAPKACLMVGGETLVHRCLRLLRNVGVTRTTIVSGFAREMLRDACGLDEDGLRFVFNPFFRTTNTLASAWMGTVGIDDDVLLLNGDTIFAESILQRLATGVAPVTLACDHQRCGDEEVKFRSEAGRIRELSKSIAPDAAEGEFLGVSKIRRDTMTLFRSACEALLEKEQFGAYYEAAYQAMIDSDLEVAFTDVGDSAWCEIDFPADLARARHLFPADLR